ncbi:RNA polymerase factor sigma-54 [Variovorax sp. HJSM1_2]|uniref:RNA polymerase factor sigma-54 n=1 Tax=Variovorax sp. HJSM1_2 TaxID=3366263 RepID=UPI003BC33E20
MKQGLSLRVSQHLALTPQLQQSIRLLQLSTLELSQEVEQMLDDNPFLEVGIDEAPREEFGLSHADTQVSTEDRESEYATSTTSSSTDNTGSDSQMESESPLSPQDDNQNWEGDGTSEIAPDDSEWGGDAPPRTNNNESDGEVDATELARSQMSLTEFLHRQALALRLSEEDRAALRFLIESLNEDGYLEDSLEELAQSLAEPDDELEEIEELQHRFTMALGLLQSLEPVGVGARTLEECLTLQLRALADDEAEEEQEQIRVAAINMCACPMDLVARRDVKRLASQCRTSDTVIKAALGLIASLEPKPGRRFVDVERNIVIPDVIVTKVGRGAQANFRVRLNQDVMPRLKVHDIYANALKQHKGGGRDASVNAALQQRLQEARWFIKNIQQRFDTILRVSNAIVDRQKNFFTHGELAMRPLVLREIADELGLHESTISRVTTAKYMSTPHGTFELKYFFGSSLGTETGGNASSTAVRALIKQFVSSEDPKKPLSDSQLSDMLKEQGIECARRTVAKYREALRIAPTNLRKAL